MSSFVWGIPSYKRAGKIKTLSYLRGMGYENIIISTQTLKDYNEYTKLYGKEAKVIYRQGASASENRNTILKAAEEDWVVFLDDDIKALGHIEGGKLKGITTRKEMDYFVENAIRSAEKAGAVIWGVYPVANSFFMKRGAKIDKLIEGTMIAVRRGSFEFSGEFKVKEDYELCCRVIASGGHTIRYGGYAVDAPHYSTPGGCHEQWGENEKIAEYLVMRYPDIVKVNPNKPGEILSVK